jgi:hypothetical protein
MRRLAERLRQYMTWATLARKQSGKSLLRQLQEVLALRKMGGLCGISDYYWYGLYRDNYLAGRGASDFLGWRLQQQLSLALNPRHVVLPAWDKLVFFLLASAAGLPVAPIKACFHRSDLMRADIGTHLRTTEEGAAFLRDPSLYPLFAKPAYSQQGFGSASLLGYDESTDLLSLLDGGSIAVPDFVKRLDQSVDTRFHRPECGFLFQEAFASAAEIRALTGWSALCGVRIVCLNSPEDGAIPIRAVWKIAVAPNHVDNFSLGKYGNLLANIDLTSGEISRTVNGFWPKTRLLREHPVTGKLLEGFRLPGWGKVLEACQLGGRAFPLMRIQHWDFALTEQGPLILELNDLGATEMLQLHGRGILTAETRAFLKRHTDIHEHPWVADL